MILGYNTNGLQNHRLDEALRLLADHGYSAVGLTLDVAHLDPFRSKAKEIEKIGTLLAKLSIRPVIETGARFVLDPTAKHEPTLMTRDPKARGRRIDFYRRCAEIGRDLGATVLSFWAGTDREPGDDSRAWLVEGVVETCAAVRDIGLEPAFEPEPGMAIETVAQYEELADACGAEAPSLCLDVGHLYVTGEGSVADVLAPLQRELAQVHLEDIVRGVHEHLLPGEGDVDFAEVKAALEEFGYPGTVCFELSRSSHLAPHALELCRSTWDGA